MARKKNEEEVTLTNQEIIQKEERHRKDLENKLKASEGTPEDQRQFTPLIKLTKDLRSASRTLNPQEARYLVDRYYQIQQYRTSAKNQIRASESEEPNEVIVWFAENFEELEKNIKKALDAYTSSHPVGAWAKSVIGVGPTFAAGLLAHIDAKKAPTAGAVWSYAGYNPSVEWLKGQKRPWNADLKKLCCHPDMMVTTRTGYVPIEKIKIGDEVLTHTGSWKKVVDVIVNEHNGKMLSMKTYGQGERGIMVTPNHPLYVTTRNTCNYTAPDGRKRFKAVDKILRKGALSDLQVMEVRQLYKEGQTLTSLAEKYSCTISSLSQIVNYKTRKEPMENNTDWYRAEDIREGWLSFYPAMPEGKEIPIIKLDTEGNAIHSIVKNGMWHVIRKIEELNYRGKVYNLEVEDDHSYVIEGMAVHNCYLIGESFVKVSNNPNDIYGKLYRQRKDQEIIKNIAGEFAEQAISKLEKFKIGKDTDAYIWYAGCLTAEKAKAILLGEKSGSAKSLAGEKDSGIRMLPPAHINERSKRYAVKIFLAHFHEVLFEYEFGTKPPNPYAISILGHAHKLEVPNYDVFKKAMEEDPSL